ncbi:hypothetical protein MASR1M65_26770 [Saprospiraceae bacterium]
MNLTAYYLNFLAPLHLGDTKPDTYENSETYLRSDTIMAAVMSIWGKTGRQDWIGNGDPGFIISSAFPYFWKDSGYVHFFPRIKLPFNLPDFDNSMAKAVKKISWMDQGYFEKVINREVLSSSFYQDIQGDFLSGDKIPNHLISKEVSERVMIPRDRSQDDSDPFYMERIFFNSGGLYFMALGDNLDRLDEALDILRYEGLGTDRSVGNGYFSWSRSEISIKVPEGADYGINLGALLSREQGNSVQSDGRKCFIRTGKTWRMDYCRKL